MDENRLGTVKNSLCQTVKITKFSHFGLFAFNDVVATITPVSPAPSIDNIEKSIQSITSTGGTQIFRAVMELLEIIHQNATQKSNSLVYFFVYTDGEDKYDDSTIAARYRRLCEQLQQNCTFVTSCVIGVGDKSNVEKLAKALQTDIYCKSNDANLAGNLKHVEEQIGHLSRELNLLLPAIQLLPQLNEELKKIKDNKDVDTLLKRLFEEVKKTKSSIDDFKKKS